MQLGLNEQFLGGNRQRVNRWALDEGGRGNENQNENENEGEGDV